MRGEDCCDRVRGKGNCDEVRGKDHHDEARGEENCDDVRGEENRDKLRGKANCDEVNGKDTYQKKGLRTRDSLLGRKVTERGRGQWQRRFSKEVRGKKASRQQSSKRDQQQN